MNVRTIGCLYLAFIALVVILSDRGSCGSICAPAGLFPHGDKVGHFVLVGLAAAALHCVARLPDVVFFSLTVSKASLFVAVLFTVEELTQLAFPSRSADFGDWAASVLGIACFELARQFRRRRQQIGQHD